MHPFSSAHIFQQVLFSVSISDALPLLSPYVNAEVTQITRKLL